MSNIPIALTIAGSDNCGGAGFQADLKTFQMQRVFGMTTITAIPVQNSLGVYDIHPVPLNIIEGQLKAIADDYQVNAFKIGMLGNTAIIECIAHALKKYDFGRMVLDPVMYAKGGAALLEPDAVEALCTLLVPNAEVITPNLPEAEALTGINIVDDNTACEAAEKLRAMGVRHAVIKGDIVKTHKVMSVVIGCSPQQKSCISTVRALTRAILTGQVVPSQPVLPRN